MSCSPRLSDDESVIHLLIDGAIPASVIGKNFLFFLQCKMSIMAHRVGLLRRTDSVAIEGIADIGEALLPVGATRMTPLQTSAALTTVTGCKIGPLPREGGRLMSNKNI